MHLDVESLRTFLAVLDHGSMTRAAEQLHLTQSAVSWKIKRLEERVGRPLLVRSGRAIRASRDGKALAEEARSIVAAHDRAVARLANSDLSGRVRLGSNEEITATRIVAILGAFNRAHPDASIEVTVDTSRDLSAAVDRGDIDVAVIQVAAGELRRDDTVLWEEELAWVTSCEMPYDSGEVPLVTFGECCNYRAVSEPLLDAAGIEHFVAFSGPTTAGVKAAVEVGLGVAVLAAHVVGDDIVPWEPGRALGDLPTMFQVARTDSGELSPLVAALKDLLVAELGEPVVA